MPGTPACRVRIDVLPGSKLRPFGGFLGTPNRRATHGKRTECPLRELPKSIRQVSGPDAS